MTRLSIIASLICGLALGIGCAEDARKKTNIPLGGKCCAAADPGAGGSCAAGLFCEDRGSTMKKVLDETYREGACAKQSELGGPCHRNQACREGVCVFATAEDASKDKGVCTKAKTSTTAGVKVAAPPVAKPAEPASQPAKP